MRGLPFLCLAMMAAPAFAQPAPPPAAPAATQAAPARPANDDQTIRCRRIEVTGSLVGGQRVCKTNAEWRRLADRGNDYAREMVDTLRARPPGGN